MQTLLAHPMRVTEKKTGNEVATLPLTTKTLFSAFVLILATMLGLHASAQSAYVSAVQYHVPSSTLSSTVYGVAADASGNVYIADAGNSRVLVESLTGLGTYSETVIANSSVVTTPTGIAVDSLGAVYVTDPGQDQVVKLTPSGSSYSSSVLFNSTGVLTGLTHPVGIAVDSSLNLYVADSSSGSVYRAIYSGGSYTGSVLASFTSPQGVAVDSTGSIYVTANGTLYKEAYSGGSYTQSTLATSLGASASVAVDGSLNVYASNAASNLIYKLTYSGGSYVQSTFANASTNSLSTPVALNTDPYGNIYVTNDGNQQVYAITPNPTYGHFVSSQVGTTSVSNLTVVFTFTASGKLASYSAITEGYSTAALDYTIPSSNCAAGTTYSVGASCSITIAFKPQQAGERTGALVLRTSATPAVPFVTASLLGTGLGSQIYFLPVPENTIGSGSTFNLPNGIAVDGYGNLYIANTVNNNIIKLAYNGTSYTASVLLSGFNQPGGVAIDSAGNLYIADTYNNQLIKETLTPTGYVSSILANATTNNLSLPVSVASDFQGNVYLSDTGNLRVLKFTLTSNGSYTVSQLPIAGLNVPSSIAVDSNLNLFIADSGASAVFALPWNSSTGNYGTQYDIGSGINQPYGIAADAFGNLYIADTSNNQAVFEQYLSPGVYAQQVVATGLTNPYGIAVDGKGNVYVSDNTADVIIKLPFPTAPTLSFPSTPYNTLSANSPDTVDVFNAGNESLTIPYLSGANPAISSTSYTWNSSASGACNFGSSSGAGTLSTGATCALPISFTPQAVGTINATMTLSDTNLNGNYATQVITLNGTSTQGTPLLTFVPNPAVITYGTALVTGQELDATATYNGATVAGTFTYTATNQSTSVVTTITAGSTILPNGTYTLTATFKPTNTTLYASGLTVSATLVVGQVTPTITWAVPNPIASGIALSGTQLNAKATYSSNGITTTVAGTFAYYATSNTTGIVTNPIVAGTFLAADSYTLTTVFTPSSTANYTSATASVTPFIVQGKPTITYTPTSPIVYGTPLSTAQLGGATVNYTNALGNPITVAGTFTYTPYTIGQVLPVGTYTLTVTFTPSDTVNYTTVMTTAKLTVSKNSPVIVWPAPASIPYETPLSATQLDAVANYPAIMTTQGAMPGTYTYNYSIGKILPGGNTTLTVTFVPTDTTDYNTVTASVTLFVSAIQPLITWPQPNPIAVGSVLSNTQLNATATDLGVTVPGSYVYSPTNGTKMNTPGWNTLTVTFNPTNTANYSAVTANVSIYVYSSPLPATTGWATPAAIPYGTTLSTAQLNPTVVYQVGGVTQTVTGVWSYVATYNGSSYPIAIGTVWSTANNLTAGTWVLTATYTPSASYNGAYQTVNVSTKLTVTQGTPQLTWPAQTSIPYSTQLTAANQNATAAYVVSGGLNIPSLPGTWAYAQPLGSSPALGTDTLTAVFYPTDTVDFVSPNTITTTITVTQDTPAITWALPASIAYGTKISGTQLNAVAKNVAGATLNGTFTYSATSLTTPANSVSPLVSGTTVLNADSYVLTTTFTPSSAYGSQYSTATASVQPFVVAQGTPVISWATPAAVVYPAAVTFSTSPVATYAGTTITSQGSFTYTYSGGTIVPGTTVLAPGSYAVTATFVPTLPNYVSTASATVTLLVTQGTESFVWPTPASIPYGTPLSATQLDAVFEVNGSPVTVTSSIGTITYTPAAGNIPAGGTQTLTVKFTAAPASPQVYTTLSSTVQLQVTAAATAITWANPAAVTYGTPLSATQLNPVAKATYNGGTVTVAGTNTYAALCTAGNCLLGPQQSFPSVGLGTILPAGTYKLTASFTPTVPTNYQSSTGTATLVVNPATPIIYWPVPAQIQYGTPLSATQLDAVSENPITTSMVVPGSYTYTPTIGYVEPVGIDTLSVSFVSSDTLNYTTAAVISGVDLTVNRATPVLTWTPTPLTFSYGTPLPSTLFNASSNVAGTWSYNYSVGQILNVNTYTLTATFSPTDTLHYTSQTLTNSFTITPAQLTLTANPYATAVYNTAVPNASFTYTLSGFVFGQTQAAVCSGVPTLSTPATQGSPVGIYTVNVSTTTIACTNYVFLINTGELHITPATLLITPVATSVVYDSQVPASYSYTCSFNGTLLGTNNCGSYGYTGGPSISTKATIRASSTPGLVYYTSNVGTYALNSTWGSLKSTSANYTFGFASSTLTITTTPQSLTVTANSYTVKQNAALPSFGYKVSGLINWDTQATTTTGSPSITVVDSHGNPVTNTSVKGTYTILIQANTLALDSYSGVTDYAGINYVNGTLTIQ